MAARLLQDRAICTLEDGQPVRQTTVVSKLFAEIGPQFTDRAGGYTRIVPLPLRRIGDGGQLVILQLVAEKTAATAETTSKSDTKKATPAPSDQAQDTAQTQPEQSAADAADGASETNSPDPDQPEPSPEKND